MPKTSNRPFNPMGLYTSKSSAKQALNELHKEHPDWVMVVCKSHNANRPFSIVRKK